MFEKLVLSIFGQEFEEIPELELTCVPEEIYYQLTEIPMELPFEV